jgi:hypothetical protein
MSRPAAVFWVTFSVIMKRRSDRNRTFFIYRFAENDTERRLSRRTCELWGQTELSVFYLLTITTSIPFGLPPWAGERFVSVQALNTAVALDIYGRPLKSWEGWRYSLLWD